MQTVLYATGNAIKFQLAQKVCGDLGVELIQTKLDIPEIQAETGEPVARDKAQKAFEQLGQPVIISDDNWNIPALGGFPGPYMKSVNEWFSAKDWLRLTTALTDRRIVLRQIAVYQDAAGQKLFATNIEGLLLREARGTSPHPHATIVSFDNGRHSNAEFHQRGQPAALTRPTVWHDLAAWLTARPGSQPAPMP